MKLREILEQQIKRAKEPVEYNWETDAHLELVLDACLLMLDALEKMSSDEFRVRTGRCNYEMAIPEARETIGSVEKMFGITELTKEKT